MASSNEPGIEDVQLYQAILDDATYPSEEVVLAIRGAREEFDLLGGLISEEDEVVEDLFKLLLGLIQPVAMVPVDASILLAEIGESEEAHVASDGKLVFTLRDGDMGYMDLLAVKNRDLLVEVVEDIVPKIRDYISSLPEVPEPVEEYPESVAPELPEFEPLPELKDLEKAPEQEPAFEEPEVVEVPQEAPQVYVAPSSEEIKEPETIEEPDFVSQPIPLAPVTDERAVLLKPTIEKKVPKARVFKAGDNGLRRLRRSAEIDMERTTRRMAELKRRRDARIRRLRETTRADWDYEMRDKKGLFSRVRSLLSRLGGRKREKPYR